VCDQSTDRPIVDHSSKYCCLELLDDLAAQLDEVGAADVDRLASASFSGRWKSGS
jgi:hypothetical protein